MAAFIATYGPQGTEPAFAKVDESLIIDRFTHSVATGKMTLDAASTAIAEFYNFAVAEQAKDASYVLFGLPAATNYNVNLPPAGWTKSPVGSGKVDMTKPAQVANILARGVGQRAARESTFNGTRTGTSDLPDPENMFGVQQ